MLKSRKNYVTRMTIFIKAKQTKNNNLCALKTKILFNVWIYEKFVEFASLLQESSYKLVKIRQFNFLLQYVTNVQTDGRTSATLGVAALLKKE